MNKTQFEDLKTQLIDHHCNSIGNLYTAHPVYEVQKKVTYWGYVEDYSEEVQLYCGCDSESVETVEEFLSYWDECQIEEFFEGTMYSQEDLERYETNQGLEILSDLLNDNEDYKYNGYEVHYGNTRWETIETFLTHRVATDFLKQKGWDSGNDNARVYVNSLYRNHQMRGLIEAITSGKLQFVEEVK